MNLTAALFLDFAQAEEMEEPEPGEDWGKSDGWNL